METILLKGLDLFRWLFVLAGTDYDQLRSIVSIKLKMDSRRHMVAQRRKEGKEPGNALVLTMVMYSIFGGLVGLALYSIPAVVPAMITFFSYIMVMVAMTLITDFSSVLLDTSDNTIILPRPVDGRTLFVARLTHILLYLSQLTTGLSLIPSIVVMVKYGVLFGLLFIVCTVLAVATALFITNAIYLLIMQFASEEKLKNIINYFQIVMAIAFMGGYQLLPRMIGRFDTENYTFEITTWKYLVPPVWFAGSLESFESGVVDIPHLILIGCALIVPVTGIYVVNRFLSPIFSRKLGAIGAGDAVRSVTVSKPEQKSFITTLASRITRPGIEMGAFELIYKILGRDRKIKLKIYPAYGYVLIFGIIFMLRDKQDLLTAWSNLPNTEYYLLLLYLTFMVIQIALHEIPFSDDFKASWIYFSAPMERPGEVLSGMLKAILLRLFVPGYIGISILIAAIWGIGALDDLVFGLFNNMIMLLVLAMLSKRYLPLSHAPNAKAQTGNLVRSILIFVFIGILGVGHFLLGMKPYLLIAVMPFQVTAIYFLHRAYRSTTWEKITL